MKIVIFFPEGNVRNNPTLNAFVDHLEFLGIRFTIKANKNRYSFEKSQFGEAKHYSPFASRINNIVYSKISSFIFIRIFTLITHFKYLFFRPNLFIGIDREGMIQAASLSSALGIKSLGLSFEIFFEDETSTRFKSPEIEACKHIDRFVIQDESRGEMFSKENLIQKEKLVFIPLGFNYSVDSNMTKIDLRSFYAIPKDKNIACVIGSLTSWSGYKKILDSLHLWPDDWVLFLHSRNSIEDELFFHKYSDLIGTRLFISEHHYLHFNELSEIVSQTDLGLAFYIATYASRYSGKNIENIGYASGKIATYLKSGIPIIANFTNQLTSRLIVSGVGYVIKEIEDLPKRLASIEISPEVSKKARLFHENKLAYDNYAILMEKLLFELTNDVH